MTPLGLHLRQMRVDRNITQKDMAVAIGVSSAYLSALEHGKRGRPSWALLQRIVGYFNVIWDDAEMLEQLALLSNPNVSINTENLSAKATELANRLAVHIDELNEDQLDALMAIIQGSVDKLG